MATKSKPGKQSTTSKVKEKTNLFIKAIPKKQTKSEILHIIAEQADLLLKQVKSVFMSTHQLMQSHMMKKGSGEFLIPEMGMKVVRKTKPAAKERQGRNPLTGETITIPAKPKKEVIRIRALKALKDVLITE